LVSLLPLIVTHGTSALINYIECTPLLKFKMASVEALGASSSRGMFQSDHHTTHRGYGHPVSHANKSPPRPAVDNLLLAVSKTCLAAGRGSLASEMNVHPHWAASWSTSPYQPLPKAYQTLPAPTEAYWGLQNRKPATYAGDALVQPSIQPSSTELGAQICLPKIGPKLSFSSLWGLDV
jgi:hypothetical protein